MQLKSELHDCKFELAAALERSNEVMESKDQVRDNFLCHVHETALTRRRACKAAIATPTPVPGTPLAFP